MMMIKLIIFLSLVLFSSGLILESHQTHVSKPVLSIDRTQYESGDKVVLSGWVSYEDKPTSDVSLRILVTDPIGSTIVDEFTTSEKDGTFEIEFFLPAKSVSGEYIIDVMSLCREEHRDICTNQSAFLRITVKGEPEQIVCPQGFEPVDGKCPDKPVVLQDPNLDEQTPPPKPKVPEWVRNIFIWYAQERISEDELLGAIQFLIDIGILESK